jgi:NAD(P)-dependent dehydrogenase (short-subunit alcohol dehydrogenase family)
MPTVLITGCSSGFGLETAVLLAKSGFRVFATMRNLDKRARLDAALAAAGAKAEILALDVTSEVSINAAIDRVVASAGGIDALVNNAGIGVGGFVEDLTLDDYRRQFETNFFGLVAMTKAVLPLMRRARSGRIVSVSSIGGRTANAVLSAYCASKHAVEGFSEALAFEAGLFNVQVVLIEPGTFKTEIFESNRELAPGARDPNSPYFEVTRALETRFDSLYARMADDPRKVAETIRRALTAPRPRLRYLVGRDAKISAAIHALGFGIYSRINGRLFSLPALAAKLRTG